MSSIEDAEDLKRIQENVSKIMCNAYEDDRPYNEGLVCLVSGLAEVFKHYPNSSVRIEDGNTVEVNIGRPLECADNRLFYMTMRIWNWNRNRDGSIWYLTVGG